MCGEYSATGVSGCTLSSATQPLTTFSLLCFLVPAGSSIKWSPTISGALIMSSLAGPALHICYLESFSLGWDGTVLPVFHLRKWRLEMIISLPQVVARRQAQSYCLSPEMPVSRPVGYTIHFWCDAISSGGHLRQGWSSWITNFL